MTDEETEDTVGDGDAEIELDGDNDGGSDGDDGNVWEGLDDHNQQEA